MYIIKKKLYLYYLKNYFINLVFYLAFWVGDAVRPVLFLLPNFSMHILRPHEQDHQQAPPCVYLFF